MAPSRWGVPGGGSEDGEEYVGDREDQATAGGGHHGTVRTSQRGPITWSGYCGRPCESITSLLGMLVCESV